VVEMLDLAVIATGETSAGERWYLKAGGSADDYYTMLETVHPDGHRDEGGMGGPVLYPDRLLNFYTGRADTGPLRVIARADQRVRQLRFRSQRGEQCEMRPAAADGELGVTLFAILLPWDNELASIEALDADGQVLEEGRIRPQRRPPAR
jgi:hypothetical protein